MPQLARFFPLLLLCPPALAQEAPAEAPEWSLQVGFTPQFYYRLNEGPGDPASVEAEAFAELAWGGAYFNALALTFDDPVDDMQFELTLGHRGDLTDRLSYDAYYRRFLRNETGDVRGELHGKFDYQISDPVTATLNLGVDPEQGAWVYKVQGGYRVSERVDTYAFVEKDDILDYTGYEVGVTYDIEEGNSPFDASLLSYVNHTEGGDTVFAIQVSLTRFLVGG